MDFAIYYTGGGIWIAEAKKSNGQYCTVESSCMDCLSLFNPPSRGDEEDKFMPDDMVWSKGPEELTSYQMGLYLLLCHMIEFAWHNFS